MGDFLKDDGTWANPSGALQSTRVTGSRTVAAGSGTQSITRVGFTPTTIIALLNHTSNPDYSPAGFSDDADLQSAMEMQATVQIIRNSNLLYGNDGTNRIEGVAAITSDGCDITWTKAGSGMDVNFSISFSR